MPNPANAVALPVLFSSPAWTMTDATADLRYRLEPPKIGRFFSSCGLLVHYSGTVGGIGCTDFEVCTKHKG